jgi:hypothetical protein
LLVLLLTSPVKPMLIAGILIYAVFVFLLLRPRPQHILPILPMSQTTNLWQIPADWKTERELVRDLVGTRLAELDQFFVGADFCKNLFRNVETRHVRTSSLQSHEMFPTLKRTDQTPRSKQSP